MPAECIIAPIPQFHWSHKDFINLSPNIFITPLIPKMRRKMLNDAKRQNASESVLRVTLESDHVIVGRVPMCESESGMLNAALYMYVVDLALKRFVDLLRLLDEVPDCFDRSCWYTADGNPAEQSTGISLGDPNWVSPPAYASGVHPGIGLAFFINDAWKSHTPELLQIDELNELFKGFMNMEDPSIFEETITRYKMRTEEFLRVQTSDELGCSPNEVEITWGETRQPPGFKHSVFQDAVIRIPEQYADKGELQIESADLTSLCVPWLFEELARIYRRKLREIERQRYVNSAKQRFLRAYQAFTNSFRMEDPFRYVARVTCLEALLGGKDSTELTHQLASRAAWLLHPSDIEAMYATYKDVKRYYSLRSKIVHGGNYTLSELDDRGTKLLALVRGLLLKVILKDKLHNLFFECEGNRCDEFLRRLSIGCADFQDIDPGGQVKEVKG